MLHIKLVHNRIAQFVLCITTAWLKPSEGTVQCTMSLWLLAVEVVDLWGVYHLRLCLRLKQLPLLWPAASGLLEHLLLMWPQHCLHHDGS